MRSVIKPKKCKLKVRGAGNSPVSWTQDVLPDALPSNICYFGAQLLKNACQTSNGLTALLLSIKKYV